MRGWGEVGKVFSKGYVKKVRCFGRGGGGGVGFGIKQNKNGTSPWLKRSNSQSAHLVCDIWTSRCRVFFVLLHNCFVSVTV